MQKIVTIVFGLFWLACSQSVLADEFDTLNFSAGLVQQHDTNLFRLADGTNPQPLVGKSARDDRITTTTLGISFKKAYSLQQFEAGYERIRQRYANYDYLNNDADNARAAWRWQFTPRLRGNLTANRSQALVGFGDFRNFGARNLRTSTTYRADADWQVFRDGWHLLGGIDRSTTTTSQVFTQDTGSRVASADFGVRYLFPSNSRIDFVSRTGRGSYLGRTLDPINQFDDGFRERRNDLRIYWPISGKSLIEGSLGHLARDNDHYPRRDFSGGVGNLKWTWTPTGKFGLITSWSRSLAAFTDATASYTQQEVYSIMPIWQASSKVKLSLKFDRTTRDYLGPVTLLPVIARQDRLSNAQLAAEWTPMRALSLSGYITHEQRVANQAGFGYEDRIAGANLRIDF